MMMMRRMGQVTGCDLEGSSSRSSNFKRVIGKENIEPHQALGDLTMDSSMLKGIQTMCYLRAPRLLRPMTKRDYA
jgi:hypothetical protein